MTTIQIKRSRPKVNSAAEALEMYRPQGVKGPSKRPVELALRLFSYVVRQWARRRRRFPLVTMLEPLEACNLTCEGCGRIREYEPVINRTLTVSQCLRAIEQSGAPIVSIAGGEPTMYAQLPELIAELVKRKIFVYCCTNGILLERMMKRIPPSKHLCWVIHLDGMEEQHDIAVSRPGVWRVAMQAASRALEAGYRVCSNTTLFHGSNASDLHQLFELVTEMGFEGVMVSGGYDYEAVPDQQLFLSRQESIQVFKRVLDKDAVKRFRFYNNPLYLDFLRGERWYQCTAWSNPTYTILGWRVPCYPLAEEGHTQDIGKLFEEELWERYGVGVNPKCTNCTMHCGFESATIFGAMKDPRALGTLVKGMATRRSGVGAS